MVKATVLAAAAASLALGQTEITNGTEAAIGKYLYTTGLRALNASTTLCVGALIAPKYVLTGASCFDTYFKWASVGTHFLTGNKDGEQIRIVKQIKHPKYNASTHENDFAVFELETPSTIAPIKVNFDPVVTPGVIAWVRGWGTFSSANTLSPVLLEAGVKVWDNVDCAKAIKPYGTLYESHICAGGEDKDWCGGDNGAPLIVTKGGEEVVVGLASWGGACAIKGVPGVYSRTSTGRTFIEQFLSNSTTPSPTTTKPSC